MCIRTRLGRLKREVFSAPVPNYAMFDSLLAALCDPLIPARVMTVGVPQTVARPAGVFKALVSGLTSKIFQF